MITLPRFTCSDLGENHSATEMWPSEWCFCGDGASSGSYREHGQAEYSSSAAISCQSPHVIRRSEPGFVSEITLCCRCFDAWLALYPSNGPRAIERAERAILKHLAERLVRNSLRRVGGASRVSGALSGTSSAGAISSVIPAPTSGAGPSSTGGL